MWYQLHQLGEKLHKRRQKKICPRCGLLYMKTLEHCPHCQHIPDQQLQPLLDKRARTRISMGRTMLLLALLIILMMLFFS